VEAPFAAVERLWPGRQTTVSELGGGITNRNYKVGVGGELFVLRRGGARTELLGIDRSVEHAAGKRAHEVGVGPEVVAFEPAEGWLVSRFIEGRPISLEDMRRPDVLQRVAPALRAFHSAAPIPGRFDAWAVVQDYRETRGPMAWRCRPPSVRPGRSPGGSGRSAVSASGCPAITTF